jgi:hypothetical protein
MKMTFTTDEDLTQVADIYVVDICDARDTFPDNQVRQSMYMGWSALRRTGVEARTFEEWFAHIKQMPVIDLEEDSPKG